MEEDILKQFREASVNQTRTVFPQLVDKDEPPEEITIVFRMPDSLLDQIEAITKQLHDLSPMTFFYPRSQLHLTVLGRIPITTSVDDIQNVLKKLLESTHFSFRFLGTGMNAFSTSISAYPVGFSIKNVRDIIRQKLQVPGNNYRRHLSEYEYMGWINFARNLEAIPTQEYRDKVKSSLDIDLGTYSPKSIEIHKNKGWTLDPKESELLLRINV